MPSRRVLDLLTAAGRQKFVDALDGLIRAAAEENPAWVQETDKAWDAIHRCLGDGTLGEAGGAYPLSRCLLAGRRFDTDPDWRLVRFMPAGAVAEVAGGLAAVTELWLRGRYFALAGSDYDGEVCEDDFGYTWEWFGGVREFYRRAAAEGRAAVFTVDL